MKYLFNQEKNQQWHNIGLANPCGVFFFGKIFLANPIFS